MEKMEKARKVVLAGLFAAVAVLLSGVHFPVGPIKAFPFQHMVNAVAGVLIGPWYAAISALIAGLIRNAMGTGTIFAFPGGIPGAIIVGLAFCWIRRDWAALMEPVGTVLIGVPLTVFLIGPIIGKELALAFFFTAFAASSIPGSVIGYLLLKTLKRAKVIK
jgi:energy coupling factor transporter S component ThiW